MGSAKLTLSQTTGREAGSEIWPKDCSSYPGHCIVAQENMIVTWEVITYKRGCSVKIVTTRILTLNPVSQSK